MIFIMTKLPRRKLLLSFSVRALQGYGVSEKSSHISGTENFHPIRD
jgi:hypothetical protein